MSRPTPRSSSQQFPSLQIVRPMPVPAPRRPLRRRRLVRSGAVLLALLGLLALALPALSGGYQGRVVGVSSGDTLTVLHTERPREVRLAGVVAPGPGEPFRDRSRRSLADLAFGRTVTVLPKADGRDGTSVAQVTLVTEDGLVLDVAEEQLRAGMAWHDDGRGAGGRDGGAVAFADPALAAAQAEARRAGRGLWSLPHFRPPWERRARGPGAGEGGGAADDEGIVYHGNVGSRKFHRPSCYHYDCPNCTALLHSREEALRSGFIPCGLCSP